MAFMPKLASKMTAETGEVINNSLRFVLWHLDDFEVWENERLGEATIDFVLFQTQKGAENERENDDNLHVLHHYERTSDLAEKLIA